VGVKWRIFSQKRTQQEKDKAVNDEQK